MAEQAKEEPCKFERFIMCSCGQYMRVDWAWELPALIKCVRCGAQWCQISWGKTVKEKP